MPAASDDAPLTEITNPRKRQVFDLLAERDGALCQHCGATTWLTIDHVDPRGPDVLENLQILCRSCNSSKSDRTDERTVRWSDGLWQRGFTMIPNAVLLDLELSPAAFRVFAVLVYLSWRPNEEWPGQDGLADLAQCSERTLRTAITELRKVRLLRTQRRGQGLNNIYILTVPPRSAISAGQDRRAEKSADQERKNSPVSPSLEELELDTPLGGGPPKLTKVDGRNLPFDALAQVCSVPVANRARVAEMTRSLKEIRAYFAAERPEVAAAGGAHFERQLEGEIVRRARLYRERWSPGTTLTPPALAKWWHDCAPDAKGERFGDIDRV